MALEPGQIVFVAFIGLLLLFSVISNVLVIVIVAKNARMRNITNVCISNLALSEILLAGFVLPQNLHDITHTKNYYEGPAFCSIVNFAPLLCVMVSIYSLVAISFERRRAILLSREQHSMKVLMVVIPVIWVWSLLVCIPTIFEYSEFSESKANTTSVLVHCGSTRSVTYSILNGLMVLFVAYVIPLVLIITNCVVVVRFIWKIGKEAVVTNQRRLVAAKKIKIIHLLVVAAALFAVSWAPYFTLLVIAKVFGLDDVNKSGESVNLIRIALSAFSAVYNVFLYVIYNHQFREEFKAIFSYCKCCRNLTPFRVAPLFQIDTSTV